MFCVIILLLLLNLLRQKALARVEDHKLRNRNRNLKRNEYEGVDRVENDQE
jgi:hypothetical protein